MTAAFLAHGDGAVFGLFSGWTFVLRAGQQLLALAPQLLTGVLLAGLLGTRGGRVWVRRGLATNSLGSMLRAAVLGLVAPVGALGALPIATELVRAGVRPAVTLCFLVTAPLLMPWSLGYAADRIGVANALLIVIGALLVALLTGASIKNAPETEAVEAPVDSSLFTALRRAAQHAAGGLLLYVLLAVAASAAFASILQPGAVEAHLGEDSFVTMLELSVPLALANLDADTAAALASEFWRIGLLTGGVFVVFYLGAGWSIGILAWCLHRYRGRGGKATLVWLASAIIVALAANAVVAPERPGEPDSHAFDMLTKPYNFGGSSIVEGVGKQLQQAAEGRMAAGLAFVALVAIGLMLRIRGSAVHAAKEGDAAPAERTGLGMTPVLVVAVLLSLVANVYSYYPAAGDLEDRLRLHSGNLFEATVVIDSDRRSAEEKAVAKGLALNALAGLEDTLDRYPIATAIRFAEPEVQRDIGALASELQQLKRLVQEGAPAELKSSAVRLAQMLRT